MSKLQLNDDGTVTIPLKGGKPPITLDEPSLGQIGRMRRAAREADATLPPVITLDTVNATAKQITEFNDALQKRTDQIFDGDNSPHGQALFIIVKELTGETVTADDVPAWAGSPRTLGAMLNHWQAPLPGPESETTT